MALHRESAAPRIRRRQFLCGAAMAGVAGAAPAPVRAMPSPGAPAATDYLFAAKEAARWVRSAEVATDGGGVWLPQPDHPDIKATVSPPDGFYSGAAGTILFFIELAQVTGDESYLDDARRGGDYLIRAERPGSSAAPSPLAGAEFSFYTGLAGTAYALAELAKATGDVAYRDAARSAADRLVAAAKPMGAGTGWMGWPGLTGNAGVVLVLLSLADLQDDRAGPLRAAAVRAGDRVVEQGIADARGGMRWEGMPPAFLEEPEGTYWPGFQLGTSGVVFALARLGAATGEKRFTAAAETGALHLRRIATVKGDAALIHYREPDAKDLFYLGYCNGPAGTARAFYQLYLATKDPHHLQWTEMLARGVMISGIPEKQTPGFWNVVCQCCGSAGVVDLFLGLWAATGRKDYLAFARLVADQMVSRETDLDGKGYRWYQAYTRVKPWDVEAETGYMIGAAGIGAALLHLHMAEAGAYRRTVRLPDDPFPAVRPA